MKFAFEADLWKVAIKRMIKLTKVFRQKDQGSCSLLRLMCACRSMNYVVDQIYEHASFLQSSLTC